MWYKQTTNERIAKFELSYKAVSSYRQPLAVIKIAVLDELVAEIAEPSFVV